MGLKLLCAIHSGGVTALPFFCLQARWNPVISRGWWPRCCTRSQQWLPWVTWQICPRTSTSRPPFPARMGGSRGSTASSDRAAPPALPQNPFFFNGFFLILMLLYHPPSPQCSQAFCAAMELSKAALEHWTVKGWCKEPALALEEFDPLSRLQEKMGVDTLLLALGRTEQAKIFITTVKAHLWAVSHCIFITPAMEVGLSHEAPVCPSWGMCGTLNSLAYMSEFREYL